MKFIKKLDAPDFFIRDTANKTSWKNYRNPQKRNLKEYILENEQYRLCCYCEKKITLEGNSSHIEHIKPKENELYSHLTFSYTNLIVSCQGDSYNEDDEKSQTTCGHKKANEIDENLFLNPTIEKNISDYFKYKYNGTIESSDKAANKSNYTITLLNLNGDNKILAEARKILLTKFRNSILKLPADERKKKIKAILDKNNQEYISFLRYRLSRFIP